ncbi:MAG: hypothetical protein JNL24_14355 [Bacteroidia bacterium]|nr:hypothetical protein [Bacteroidia bacterium]
MKQLLFIIASLLLFSFIQNGKEKHVFKNSYTHCKYETTAGRLNGTYVSYYPNGKKKAGGFFENNYRIGKWTVWDSTGRMRMQRVYTDPFHFTRIVPAVPKDAPVQLLNTSPYEICYNEKGYIHYFPLQERAVMWSKRIWREIRPSENPVLFNNNKLFQLINKGLNEQLFKAYNSKDDEFREELKQIQNTNNLKVIAFKLKEDTFFDKDRLVSESRIIGICPVAINNNTNDTSDLYWIYFPELRTILAQEQVQITKQIKSMDDLFFYRYFYGQIYKESNVYDRPISAYAKGMEAVKESERIEMSLIESEHDIWISLAE